jgi:hypothetical protein
MSNMSANSVDDFLSEYTGGWGGTKYLSKWKKKRTVLTWMHTKLLPQAVWRHPFPRINTWVDKVTQKPRRAIFGHQYVSHERFDVLDAQYFRDDEGERKLPPEKCPMSLLIEYVHGLVERREVPWTEPLFHFEVETEDRDGKPYTDVRVIHTGGFIGLFGRKDLTREQLIDLREHRIHLRDENEPWKGAWAQNANAKLAYIFPVVDHDDVESGVQIAIESKLLRQKVKAVVEASRKNLTDPRTGEVENKTWDPFTHPYCVEWKHNPNAKAFDDMFEATKMGQVKITKQIEDLVRGPAPDISGEVEPLNAHTLRAVFERHCVLKGIPWDEIFKHFPVRESYTGESTVPEIATRREELAPVTPHNTGTAEEPHGGGNGDTCPECGDAADCPHVGCVKCEGPMMPEEAVCKHCGHDHAPPVAAATPPAKAVAQKTAPPTAPTEDDPLPF